MPALPTRPDLIGIEGNKIVNSLKKLINKVLGRLMCPHCDFVLGENAYALICPDCHKQILRNRPCTDYIK